MNIQTTKTRSQQRLEQLLAITNRPLTDKESDELYKALHADYMRKWRAAKVEAEYTRLDLEISKIDDDELLERVQQEMVA